jgi:hypothetical protein
MPTSTPSAALLIPPESDIPLEQAKPHPAARPELPAVVLSARARERLRVLNQVLEAAVPRSADEHGLTSTATIVE